MATKILGITQLDIIVRNAIEAALMDLRANTWLLDYVFASLPQDDLTKNTYGKATVDRAKEWFLGNFPQVVTGPVMDEMKLPLIEVEVGESSEAVAELSTGDVHWEATEENTADSPILAGPFVPASYEAETGTVTLVEALDVPVFAGQVLIDYRGTKHVIEEVLSDTEIKLPDGTIADFSRAILKSADPAWRIEIESASYKETCRVNVYTQSEPEWLIWLHSIVVFSLLRYKETLLEARGYERTVLASTRPRLAEFSGTEIAFARTIEMSGYVRQYWPKAVHRKVDGILFDKLINLDAETVPPPESADNALWVGVDDE